MTSFPDDLLIEILSLLPVVTLLKFRCVCKSWYALLHSPDFISKHVSNSDNNVSDNHHRLIVVRKAFRYDWNNFKILSYKTLKVMQPDFGFLFYKLSVGWYESRFLGCYNGLVCLSSEELKEIAFWNPATRQSKVVISKLTIQQKEESKMEHTFGYDFKTNDYKAMKITTITEIPSCRYEIEVYSFNTDSWRDSSAVIPDGFCFDRYYVRPTTCVRGISSTLAYTHAKNSEVRKYYLFTFDMSNEAFIVTPMPEEAVIFEARNWRYKALTELKGSVSFIKHQPGPSENEESFTVFILNVYGPEGIWTKLYTIAPLYGAFYNNPTKSSSPIGFWKNDELIIDIRDEYLVLCDAKTHKVKKLRIGGVERQILEYKESLVWINDGDHCFGKKKTLDFIPLTTNSSW